MKKIITVMLCIVLVLLFAGCGKNGDTSKVEIDYGASSVYSKAEIDSAIEIIKKQFASFEGCELHSLSYMPDEECNNADMAISVPVPKDLSGIKTKVALNLTKRQIICFSGAAITGVPLYFLTKGVLGTQAAALIMVGVMLPFFFLAMYERETGFRQKSFCTL